MGDCMSNLKDLFVEFKELKRKLFGKDLFAVLDDNDPNVKRYNQLLGYFHPQFRTSDWVEP